MKKIIGDTNMLMTNIIDAIHESFKNEYSKVHSFVASKHDNYDIIDIKAIVSVTKLYQHTEVVEINICGNQVYKTNMTMHDAKRIDEVIKKVIQVKRIKRGEQIEWFRAWGTDGEIEVWVAHGVIHAQWGGRYASDYHRHTGTKDVARYLHDTAKTDRNTLTFPTLADAEAYVSEILAGEQE